MQLRTHCNRDCPDACSMVVTVEHGRAVRLQGDPDHPVTRGFLCRRTSRFLERQYDERRLTTPLVRRGGELRPASWDEALDLVAETFLRIRDESGPAAVLQYRCGGSLGLMKHVTDHFFELFGPVTVKSGDVCTGAGDWAQEQDFGDEESNDLFTLLDSRQIVLWGKNPHVSQVHLLPVLRRARQGGARVTLIDPIHHRGVSLADEYLRVRPGGDLALALGAARVLVDGGRADPEVERYCDGVDGFVALARSRPVDEWAGLADVTPAQVAAVAEALADRPCAVLIGWGMQRRERGAATIRAIDALVALSGNVGVRGGGASFYYKRRGAFDLSFQAGAAAAPRTIPEPLLGPGILDADDPPIRAAFITAANPVCMLPESRTVARALETRDMTVVVDSFLTDTARCAHVVLPTTTLLEEDDLVGAYGHHWIGEVRPVLEPPPGVKSDHEILLELAPRLGMDAVFGDDAEAWKRRMLSKVAGRGGALEDLRAGPVRNPLAPEVVFEDRTFATPTGRARLLEDADPTPPAAEADRPLLLMSLSTDRAQGSQWPERTQQGPLEVTVHPDASGGLEDGDLGALESAIGALPVVVRLDPRQRRDVALVEKGGWLGPDRCANAIIPARASDHGGCAVYHDTPVRLVPAGRP